MERLTIENFSCIKKADFDVGRMNIIIGPQATGKSVIAKLLYFFRESLREKEDIYRETLILDNFEKKFPEYTWNEQDFKIVYYKNTWLIEISKTKYSIPKVRCSDDLDDIFKEARNGITESTKNMDQDRGISSSFIPASRSFFATLQNNIFAFLAKNIEIDVFIKEFGLSYERSKKQHEDRIFESSPVKKKIDSISYYILSGVYKYEQEQDWIISDDKKINLSDASSGQQESLPMLLILSTRPFFRKKCTFFIEEPEAHLFPVSQKHIMSLFALIYKRLHHDFVITTHSPYILTALNNMILTHELCVEKGEERVSKITDVDFSVPYEDVRAYTIEDGELVSILDKENQLIAANVIDSVSDNFDRIFDGLLQLQMED